EAGSARRRCHLLKDGRVGRWIPACAGMVFLLVGTGCTVGPDYQRPPTPVPAAYKETLLKQVGGPVAWRLARPAEAVGRGAWWSVYRDPGLDNLERQIDVSNQNLRASEAAYRQSEAIVTQARAGFFPTLNANAQAQRSRSGGVFNSASGGTFSAPRGGGG